MGCSERTSFSSSLEEREWRFRMTILRGFVPFIATALSLTFLKAAGRFLIGSEQTRKVAPFCKQIGQSIGIKNTQESAQRLAQNRSEEHTSELQSLMRISYDVFC